MTDLIIYNTLTRQKEKFVPLQANQVRMYVCGMTVYDYCHLGHGRIMVFFDVVQRYLRYRDYQLTYVRNITDIDDKIIKRAQENNEPMSDLTTRFIQAMHEDSASLSVIPPDQEPRATDHIQTVIALIARLLANHHAYQTEDGDICFEVASFANYGQLSQQDLSKLHAGSRVSIIETKRDPLDFVLWKKAKAGEPAWPSPWGDGRPGWHIECSAMSLNCLGDHFDLHGGGLDLTFPHHENEIAQSEGATGNPVVKTWMHVGYVQVAEEKMSKSLGNFSTLRDLLQKYRGEVIRYYMLSSHYRSPIQFSFDLLDQAQAALLRFYTAMVQVTIVPATDENVLAYRTSFIACMNDDFNTPQALAVLFDLMHELNRVKTSDPILAGQYVAMLRELSGVLGILQENPETIWQHAGKDTSAIDVQWVDAMIAKRNAARVAKDWAGSDAIRDELAAAGIVLEDRADQTIWRQG